MPADQNLGYWENAYLAQIYYFLLIGLIGLGRRVVNSENDFQNS